MKSIQYFHKLWNVRLAIVEEYACTRVDISYTIVNNNNTLIQVDQFLDSLLKYDKEHIHPNIIHALDPYLKNPEFDPDFIRSKSGAAAGLCSWVINVVRFYEVNTLNIN